MGIKAVLIFVKVLDNLKDNTGSEAINPEGLDATGSNGNQNQLFLKWL